jgi:hypothetical protein
MSNRRDKILFVQPRIAVHNKDEDYNSLIELDGTNSLMSYSGSGVKSNDATTQSRRSLVALTSDLSRYAKSDLESDTPRWERNFQIRGDESWNFFSHHNQNRELSPVKLIGRHDEVVDPEGKDSADPLSSSPSLRVVKSANAGLGVMIKSGPGLSLKSKTSGMRNIPGNLGFQVEANCLSPSPINSKAEVKTTFSKVRFDEQSVKKDKELRHILGSGSGMKDVWKPSEDPTNIPIGSHFAVIHTTYMKGKLRNELGDEFEGEICFGQASGYGILRLAAQNYEYRGNFSNDLRQGPGEEFLRADTRTVCQFEKGLRHGKFETHFPDGSIFKGTYHAGIPSLFGIFISPCGTQFGGNFVDGLLEGQGTVEYSNGDRFIGNFHLNHRHGLGKLIWTNKKVLEGNWVDDQTLENGYLYDPATNSKEKVSLVNGKLMKSKTDVRK